MKSLFGKYKTKLLLLAVMCLAFVAQAGAQFFEDDGGPGGFDPPPDNDVPLDTYQWIMMGLALIYGFYIFWKNHKKNEPGTADDMPALIPVKNSVTIHQILKSKNHDTVFNLHRTADSNLHRLPGSTGKRKKKNEALLWLLHPQKKRAAGKKGCLSTNHSNNQVVKLTSMKTKLCNMTRNAICYRAILILCGLLGLVAASANDGGAASIPVKGGVPINYYEGFMLSIAAGYGIYLVIRARRRKRNSKLSQ